MNGTINNASPKDLWNESVIKHNGSFLQSWEWGEFQERLGRKIWRISSEGTDRKFLYIQYQLPFKKNYLYCPRPIFNSNFEWEKWLEKAKIIAGEEKFIFIKVDPELTENDFKKISDDKCSFKKSPQEIQPKDTLILNLGKSEEELLSEMKPKTRYNIKLARRRGLVVINNKSLADKEKYFDSFWSLLCDTVKRNKFYLHPKEYYQIQLSIPNIRLFLAEYQKQIIVGAVVMFFGKRATYLHGASGDNYKNLMAPYLLHWEIIKYAQKNGFKEYDFWGTGGDIGSRNWAGITRFKNGFGGKEYGYVGAYDYAISKIWYNAYKLGKKLMNR